jgi:hypothetical protein
VTGESHRPPQVQGPPVLASKLRPATTRSRPVSARLRDVLRPRFGGLVLVHAAAGYGKTTALAATHGAGSTWYNLDATDREPAAFAVRLSLAIGLEPPLTEGAAPEVLAMELARRLQGQTTTVTLDRCEQLGEAAALGQLLSELLLLAPALALRMATRTRPPLPLERMRLEGRLVDLGPAELRLDRTEIAELLTAAWKRPPCAAELDFADSVLAGWPAALELWQSGVGSQNTLVPLLPGQPLHEYLQEQVIGTLPEDVQDHVRRDWRWLLGPGPLHDRASNSRRRTVVERLVRDRVAVVPDRGGWRLHPLIRTFARMRNGWGGDAIAPETVVVMRRPPSAEIAPGARQHLTIRTFGGLCVLLDWVPVPDPAWSAASRRLLELLVSMPGYRTTAGEAAQRLWPRHPARAARNSFNVALHGLRRALEPGLTDGARSSYVVREGRWYQLRLDRVTCDTDEFERLVRQVQSPLDEAGAQRLQAAVDLHAGDFLASSGETFVADRRTELRTLLLTSLEKLAQWHANSMPA